MPNIVHFAHELPHAHIKGVYHDRMPKMPAPENGQMYYGCRVTFNFVPEEWSKDNDYKFYDVVHFKHTSYIAKCDIPAGIDISDIRYWVRWAEPNYQLQELYDVVNSFNARIKKLEAQVEELINILENTEDSENE